MGKRMKAADAERFERRVRHLLDAGHSPARISAETGKSYVHTVRIVERIRNDTSKGSNENERNR